MDSRSAAQALVAHWEEWNVLREPGASEAQIELFEERQKVSLPADFKAYLRLADGTDGMDKHVLMFWSIDRIQEYEDLKNVYVFVDYFVWMWAFAIALGSPDFPDGTILRVGTIPDAVQVSSSFSEFVDMYLKDADKLIFPDD